MKKTVEQGGDLFPSYSVSCCYQKRKALQKLEMDRDLFQGWLFSQNAPLRIFLFQTRTLKGSDQPSARSKITYDPPISRVSRKKKRQMNLEAFVVKKEKDCDQETNSVKILGRDNKETELLLSLTSKWLRPPRGLFSIPLDFSLSWPLKCWNIGWTLPPYPPKGLLMPWGTYITLGIFSWNIFTRQALEFSLLIVVLKVLCGCG